MRVRVLVGGTALLVAAGLGLVPTAQAAPVTKTETASVTYGNVTFVPDGDTIDVKIDDVSPEPGRSGTRIRFVGLQAMEQHSYKVDLAEATGECNALAATAKLRSILGGQRNDYRHRQTDGARVELTAKNINSSSRARELRMVSVKNDAGGYDDVAIPMLKAGMALPFFNATEYSHNRDYRLAAREAAAAGLGIWNPASCGGDKRPAPTAGLAMAVNWNAPGNDAANLNGEYFRVTNTGSTTVSLKDWWVRDSSLRDFFHFPAGATLRPGQKAYVHVGKGKATKAANGSLHYYWGQTSPAFENITGSPTYMGDGGYLFDTYGNLRAYQMYGLT